LLHGVGRQNLGATWTTHRLRRHAGYGAAWRNVFEHDRARGDPRALADLDIAEHLGARADHHAAAHLGMTVAAGFAGAAERDGVQHGDIVLHDSRFADD